MHFNETTYYKSPEHKNNALVASKIATLKLQQLKQLRINDYLIHPTLCTHCNVIIPYKKRTNKFCSKRCAVSFNNIGRVRSEISKLKTSNTIKHKIAVGEFKTPKTYRPCSITQKTCTVCRKSFEVGYKQKARKTCCRECNTYASVTIRSYPNGRRKLFEYVDSFNNKVTLESSWELIIAKHLDEKRIKWIRPEPVKWFDNTNKSRLYYPDFYLIDFDLYVDPKNLYAMTTGNLKMLAVDKLINIIYGDIKYILSELDNLNRNS